MSEKIEKQAVMIGKILTEIAKSGIETRPLGNADVGEAEENQGLFLNAVQWLEREGLISFEKQGVLQNFHGCALRAKGFAVLGMEIDLQGGKLTVRDAAKQVSSGRIDAATAGDFIGALVGGFTKSMSG